MRCLWLLCLLASLAACTRSVINTSPVPDSRCTHWSVEVTNGTEFEAEVLIFGQSVGIVQAGGSQGCPAVA